MPRRLALLALLLTPLAPADEKLAGIACRSVHLGYPAPTATAFYNEATVRRSADGTYFMVCGWSKGYFGMQELANGKKLVLFSVWDPTDGDDPKTVPVEKRVKLLHQGDGVRVKRFGNEGTGGQSFFDFDWQPDQPYRFLVTARPDGPDRTAYSGHFYRPDRKEWMHLVTFSTLTPKGELLKGCYSFVEDFRRNKVSTTKERRAEFGNGWVKVGDDWRPLNTARFTADANPAKSVDAGTAGGRFYLATGGTTPDGTPKLRTTLTLPAADRQPPADLPAAGPGGG